MTSFESTFNEETLRRLLQSTEVHPDDIGTLLRYAPAALTHLCWRNSIVEDWHAGPDSRISDAEMMRANISTTRIFHQSLWFALGESWADVGPFDESLLDPEVLAVAFADALADAFDIDRLLPHGITLGDLGGEEFDELQEHAALQLSALVSMAERHGSHTVVMWLGLRGLTTATSHWWGTPKWPFIVDEFFRRLDDPEHERWRSTGPPGPPPPPAHDRLWFRKHLLTTPEDLPTAVVEYCIHDAAIGFIRLAP